MKWAGLERIGEGLLVAVAATAITTSVHTCVQHRDWHAAQAAAVERAKLQGESDEEVLRDTASDDLRSRLRAIERAAD